ncbi:MAG: metal-sulfur cluster assembly factor [Desulfurococcales archaeon]|nr:metal-sulfur cluster assembly factor [Desulfurococcales archaeon]
MSGGQRKFPVITGPKEVVEKVIKALKDVYDPEIPVNVYDLGLVYEIHVEETKPGKYYIKIAMTLTAIGCPVAGQIAAYAEDAIREMVPEAEDVEVEIVFDPPWSPDYVTPEGRELLKAVFGYDVVEEWKRRLQADLSSQGY